MTKQKKKKELRTVEESLRLRNSVFACTMVSGEIFGSVSVSVEPLYFVMSDRI
jgi:hypothetical protein